MNEHAKSKHPVNIHVGKRIRQRRRKCGLSVDDLAKAVHCTQDDILHNEQADRRVGSSRLYEISKVLGVSLGYFFEGFSPENMAANSQDIQTLISTYNRADRESQQAIMKVVKLHDCGTEDSE